MKFQRNPRIDPLYLPLISLFTRFRIIPLYWNNSLVDSNTVAPPFLVFKYMMCNHSSSTLSSSTRNIYIIVTRELCLFFLIIWVSHKLSKGIAELLQLNLFPIATKTFVWNVFCFYYWYLIWSLNGSSGMVCVYSI